jgi:hypothetical protein
MAAAVFITALVMTPPPSAPAPAAPAVPPAVTSASGALRPAGSDATTLKTLLAPETPGCETIGLSGRMSNHRDVADWHRLGDAAPAQGGAKRQGAQPRIGNPVEAPQTVRPAMQMCVVDQFNPADISGFQKTIYRL